MFWIVFAYASMLANPLHKGGRAAFRGPPTFVESIMGDGGLANIEAYAKTFQNMFVFVFLPWINKPPWTVLARGGLINPFQGGFINPGSRLYIERDYYLFLFLFL